MPSRSEPFSMLPFFEEICLKGTVDKEGEECGSCVRLEYTIPQLIPPEL